MEVIFACFPPLDEQAQTVDQIDQHQREADPHAPVENEFLPRRFPSEQGWGAAVHREQDEKQGEQDSAGEKGQGLLWQRLFGHGKLLASARYPTGQKRALIAVCCLLHN